jgi:hypothetical protein
MGLLDFKNTLQQAKKDLLDKPKEVLLNQAKRELLGEKEINQPDVLVTFEEEKSFQSGGYKRITRYYQALRYGKDVYGMECNPCCVMYFLQNYGLIPPNISRKQFEYAFTPLNPDKKTQNTQAKQKRKDYSGIYLDNNLIIPKEDLFDNLFPKGASNFLRGREGAVFPHWESSHQLLLEICNRFYSLGRQPKYSFLQDYLQDGYYSLSYEGINNKYAELVAGITDRKYFEKHVILIGLYAYKPPYPAHYCLIVDVANKVEFMGFEFWSYPADDPYQGNVRALIPTNPIQDLETLKEELKKTGKNFLIFPNAAIGV